MQNPFSIKTTCLKLNPTINKKTTFNMDMSSYLHKNMAYHKPCIKYKGNCRENPIKSSTRLYRKNAGKSLASPAA